MKMGIEIINNNKYKKHIIIPPILLDENKNVLVIIEFYK